MKMFQTRMDESRRLTDNSARGDYHANFEISLIAGACVFPWYTSDIKGQ